MPGEFDGGVRALAGFLYQILGLVDMTAHAFKLDTSLPRDDIDNLILRVGGIGKTLKLVRHEGRQDVDLTFCNMKLEESDDVVLIQYKYSSSPKDHSITPAIINNILTSFDDSVTEAKKAGQNVTACVLITNRPFTSLTSSGGAQAVWQQASTGQPYELRLVDNYPIDDQFRALRQFGYQFGASDDEITDGACRIIGRILQNTGMPHGNPTLDKKDFVELIVGYRDARELTEVKVTPICRTALDWYKSRGNLGLGFPVVSEPIHRDIIDKLAQLCSQRALVVLYGAGGCGKTVALWHWLYLTNKPSSLKEANNITDSWIIDETRNWLGLAPSDTVRKQDHIEHAVERMRRANPTSQTIIHLGLDGVDEFGVDRTQVSSVINWFINEDIKYQQMKNSPAVVLVVTCRDVHDFMDNWMYEPSGFGEIPEPATLPVDIFSNRELLSAVEISDLDQGIKIRIESAIQSYISSPLLSGSLPSPTVSADPSFILELRQPVIWHSFVSLDPTNQLNTLDGDIVARDALAEMVVNRFIKKALQRPRCHDLGEELLRHGLKLIAGHTCSHKLPWYERISDWENPAISDSSLLPMHARQIYDEALSQGIIIQDIPGKSARLLKRWQWKHEWLAEHIASLN